VAVRVITEVRGDDYAAPQSKPLTLDTSEGTVGEVSVGARAKRGRYSEETGARMESSAFAAACGALEELTGMSRLQSRGTIRILLRDADLEPESVTTGQLLAVIGRLLPEALRSRAIADEETVCSRLRELLVAESLRPLPEVHSEGTFEHAEK
jgi:hypothetical protein